MGEDKVAQNGNGTGPQMAASSHSSSHLARRRTDPEQADHLKQYRFPKGVSGNKAGINRRLQVTEFSNVLLDSPLPERLHAKLEQAMEMTLPPLTWNEGINVNKFLASFGAGVGFRLDVAESIANRAEGLPVRKVEIVEPVQRDDEAMRQHMWMKMLEMTYKRAKLYDMPMPEQLVKDAEEAGVDLDEAFGDKKKPSPPEADIGDKEPRGSV